MTATMLITFQNANSYVEITTTCTWSDGTSLTANDWGYYTTRGQILSMKSKTTEGDTKVSGNHTCFERIPTGEADFQYSGSCFVLQGIQYQKIQ